MQLDKNILKQYFRSGSRPTQKQFYELIDNCYNEAFTSFVSGYHLLIDESTDKTIKALKREAGKTVIVPFFSRINTKHHRFYHYAIPVANLGSGFQLDKIILDMSLPPSTEYSVKDRSREVQITQKVKVDSIRIYNGPEQIYEASPDSKDQESVQELQIKSASEQWKGISIDISIAYEIKSDIAVSDQFDITAGNEHRLEHLFGSAGCIFKPI
jgi:hypothetical protein